MPVTKRTGERGYGAKHQTAKKQWAAKLKQAGALPCARCGQLITPDEPWDLGHTDDRTAYTGPEHVTCNRSAGGKNGAAVTNAKRGMTIREW